jgi:biotin-(acetyl-CoA carboxylase) ligase
MATKSLSAEIADNITELKMLKLMNPSKSLSNRLQNMYDALHQVQGKEWEEQVEKYKEAKNALDSARKATQDAINDLTKTAEAIEKSANAFVAVIAALSFAL